MDSLDLNDNGPKKNKSYRIISIISDKSVKFGWTFPMKNENGPTKKNFSENIFSSSQIKPNLIETDVGKEFLNNFISVPI